MCGFVACGLKEKLNVNASLVLFTPLADTLPFIKGVLIRWEGVFAEARRNNIKRLSMNFGASEIDLLGGKDAFKSIIGGFHLKYCPNTVFEPEITYISACNAEQEAEKIDCYISSGFFQSIDVCGGENGSHLRLFCHCIEKRSNII